MWFFRQSVRIFRKHEDSLEYRMLCLFELYINQIQFSRSVSLSTNKMKQRYFESMKKIVAMIVFLLLIVRFLPKVVVFKATEIESK